MYTMIKTALTTQAAQVEDVYTNEAMLLKDMIVTLLNQRVATKETINQALVELESTPVVEEVKGLAFNIFDGQTVIGITIEQ